MKSPGHRRGRLHRLPHRRSACSSAATRSSASTTSTTTTTSRLKQARLARLQSSPGFRFVKLDLADRAGMATLFARERFAARGPPRRAGRRALLAREPACLRRQQPRRLAEHPGRLPPQRRRAPGVRLDQLGLRRQHQDAVLGAPERRSSAVALCGDQEGQRADGAHLRRLYGLPTTGLRFFTVYGPWGRPDMALFLFTRNILAGKPIDVFNYGHHKRDFTYRRRHRRGRGARAGPRRAAESGLEQRCTRTRRPAARPTGSTTSATTSRCELMHYIEVLEECLGARPQRTCCRCSPATCRTPTPTSRIWCATSATGRRPVEDGVRRSSTGIGDYYKAG